ncbi:MAG: LpqB family beta-propeller domain-containing protein [Propionibacteriaceae bacterium]|jgi:hypothetical protein|nr:LpqB family beta-propeller domain-containing protein [Propionibacteriaceae bacterium]
MNRPRPAVALAAGLLLAAVTACSGIPTDGAVGSEPKPAPTQNAGDIAIEANAPAQGAKPNAIIDGFFVAMAQYEPGYATARLFLSEQAAAAWRPGNSVRIYADLAGLTMSAEGTIARLPTTQLVGQLDVGGVYTAADAGTSETLEFGLAPNAAGEWRIDRLPADLGVVVSRARFNTAYQRVETYYFDDTDQVLIPDTRYLPRGNWLRQPIEALLAGPSQRVAAIVRTDVIAAVSLDPDRDPVLSGGSGAEPLTAEIYLAEPTAELSVADATHLAIQCAATLRQQVANLAGVRLVVGNTTLRLDGAAPDGTLPVTAVDAVDPNVATAAAAAALIVASDGALMSLGGTCRAADLGEARDIRALAVGPACLATAVVVAVPAAAVGDEGEDEGEGEAGEPTGEEPEATPEEAAPEVTPATAEPELELLEARGGNVTRLLSEPGLIRPQYDRSGRLWAMAAGAAGTRVWLVDGGEVTPVAAPALAGEQVVAFRLAPDGRRLAAVVETVGADGQVQQSLQVATIVRAAAGTLELTGWRTVPVVVDDVAMASFQDVAWAGPTSLAVIAAATGADANALYRVRLDGLDTVEELGRPGSVNLIELATSPGGVNLLVRDANNRVDRWLDTHDWRLQGTGFTALGYAVG